MELVKSEVPYIKIEVDNNEFIIEGDENGEIAVKELCEKLSDFFLEAYGLSTDLGCNKKDLGYIYTTIKGEEFLIDSNIYRMCKVRAVAWQLARFVKKAFNEQLEWGEYKPSLEKGDIEKEDDDTRKEKARERQIQNFMRREKALSDERERKKNEPPIKKYDVVNIPTDEEASRYTYYISEQRKKGKIIDNESCYLDKCLVDVLCRIRDACRREERFVEVSTDEITEGAIKAFEDAGYGVTRWSLLGKDDNFVTISWGRWL